MSVTAAVSAGGAIPKRNLPRTNSQSSTNDDLDGSLLVPGKKLGKEKKGMLNSLIKKGKRGEKMLLFLLWCSLQEQEIGFVFKKNLRWDGQLCMFFLWNI